MKNKEQTGYILGAIILLVVLYFGFDNKPSTQKALEKSRSLDSREYDISSFRTAAVKGLTEEELEYLETQEAQVQHARIDSVRLQIQKQLSGYWFSLRQPVLAGLYARQIALTENTGSSWAIAGTTFASGLQREELNEDQKLFARNQALEAFENAISLEPEVVDHRINQALCYIELPESGEPMKGIQMLAGMATQFPESPLPPYHLARLAVQTGQYERALTRIEQALALDAEDARIACLAVEIYGALGRSDEAKKMESRCAGTK